VFAITRLGSSVFLAHGRPDIWTTRPENILSFATAEQAQVIADGLWKAKATIGGFATFEIDAALIAAKDASMTPTVRDPIDRGRRARIAAWEAATAKDGTLRPQIAVVQIRG